VTDVKTPNATHTYISQTAILRAYRPERGTATVGWTQLHTEEFVSYSIPNIIIGSVNDKE
jgi:hypothetical protein